MVKIRKFWYLAKKELERKHEKFEIKRKFLQ